jgi:hypothetical protein
MVCEGLETVRCEILGGSCLAFLNVSLDGDRIYSNIAKVQVN